MERPDQDTVYDQVVRGGRRRRRTALGVGVATIAVAAGLVVMTRPRGSESVNTAANLSSSTTRSPVAAQAPAMTPPSTVPPATEAPTAEAPTSVPSTTEPPGPATYTVTNADNRGTLEVRVGDEIHAILEPAPGGRYSPPGASADGGLLAELASSEDPATGTVTATFQAVAPGTTSILAGLRCPPQLICTMEATWRLTIRITA